MFSGHECGAQTSKQDDCFDSFFRVNAIKKPGEAHRANVFVIIEHDEGLLDPFAVDVFQQAGDFRRDDRSSTDGRCVKLLTIKHQLHFNEAGPFEDVSANFGTSRIPLQAVDTRHDVLFALPTRFQVSIFFTPRR